MPDSSHATPPIASHPGPYLTCCFKTSNETVDGIGIDSTSGRALLFQETGKKSSYLLQPKKEGNQESSGDNTNEEIDYYSVPTPAHLVVEHDMHPTGATSTRTSTSTNSDTRNCPFFFGGLQIVFSAKTMEIYLTNPGGKETYLMTCKGIPYRMNKKEDNGTKSVPASSKPAEWHRAICVVPGGPRNITRLRIKLIGSISGADSITAKLHYMKLTARIPDHSSTTERTATTRKPPIATANSQRIEQNPRNSNHSMLAMMMGSTSASATTTPTSEPPLTQSDLGAAMAGLSFMARKTEENMADLFKQQSNNMVEHMNSCFKRLEIQTYTLQSSLTVQHQLTKENQTIMKEQQRIIEYQSTQIEKLLNDNHDLKVRMQALQTDFSILGSQGSLHNSDEDKKTRKIEERHSDGGCGCILDHTEEDIAKKINGAISSHINPSITASDTTANTAKGVQNNNDDESCNHIANIEVMLVEDDPVAVNEADDDDCEDVSHEDKSFGESIPEGLADIEKR